MFDAEALELIKSICIDSGFGPDGIYFDSFNDRVYVFSHPTKDAMVIDSKRRHSARQDRPWRDARARRSQWKGTLYVVMQDKPGGVAVVDVKTMKATAH